MNFSAQFIELRKQAGMSVYRLSAVSGLPKSTIFSYEQGVTPTLDKADKLLKALGVSLVIGEAQLRHGKWILDEDKDGVHCSECGCDYCTLIYPAEDFIFCPKCGAKMDNAMVDIEGQK